MTTRTANDAEQDLDDEDLDQAGDGWDQDAGDCDDCGSPITAEDSFVVDGFTFCERCAWSVAASGGRLL